MTENPRPDRPTDRPTDGPIGAVPSRNLGGPSALLGEKVEAEPDAFVGKRHANGALEEGERLVEEAWAQSERRYDRERRRENRARWYGRHLEQAERYRRTLKGPIARHDARAERLREDRGEGAWA